MMALKLVRMKKKVFLCLLLGFLIISACSKMDDYKKYTDGKEILYSGKADSLVAYGGKNRIQLSWKLISDPKTTKAIVYWRNKMDSLVVPIDRSGGVDHIDVILDNMEEGSYSFEVVTFHGNNNISVPSFVHGRVYGDKYTQTLLNRTLLDIEALPNDDIKLKWGNAADTTMVGVEIKYKAKDGTTQTFLVKNSDIDVIITDYFRPSSFQYRTAFLPQTNALDTFYTFFETATPVYEKLLNKGLFKDVTFPGDAAIYTDQGPGIAKVNLWDGRFSQDYENPYYDYFNMTTNDNKAITYITIDLGVVEQLKRFRLNHYYPYTNRAPRKYEIWGSENPAADGSWESWTKLADVEQVKPSGGPGVTNADKEAWVAGDNVNFPLGLPKVRYIRIKCIENWRGWDTNMAFSEVTFWAYEQD